MKMLWEEQPPGGTGQESTPIPGHPENQRGRKKEVDHPHVGADTWLLLFSSAELGIQVTFPKLGVVQS